MAMSDGFGNDVYWPQIKKSWDIFAAAGESRAKISVRNLQATIRVGRDAWGRDGKVQPILISATVSLRRPFHDASVQDTVDASTIHYGVLSKTVLESALEFQNSYDRGVVTENGRQSTVKHLMDHIMMCLSLFSLSGKDHTDFRAFKPASKSLLPRNLVDFVQLEILLPKALLNSKTGVSRRATVAFPEISRKSEPVHYDHLWGMSVVLHDLQVSTLIGVNPNERLAKQLVIANVEVDVWVTERDVYNELEEIAVKTIEESSFQTLESLALHLAWRISRLWIQPAHAQLKGEGNPVYPRIKISLEKPTAVTMADAPLVEILVDSKDMIDRALPSVKALPFPLQGRLDEWVRENDAEGLSKDPVLGS